MNTQLTIKSIFELIKHAAREITYTDNNNTTKTRKLIKVHTNRINSLLDTLEERKSQEAQALIEDIDRKMEQKND